MTFTIRPYTDELRRMAGWVKTEDTRAGGVRLVTFEKKVDHDRTLNLQLWADGRHRVTFTHKGRMATLPTSFETVPQMVNAVAYETRRSPAAVTRWGS